MNTSIIAENISVSFPVFENSHRSLKNTILSASSGGKLATNNSKGIDSVDALSNLSFEVIQGEKVGLFGHNGSGKTTLLRSLSGIYTPVSGNLKINGRVASLLDIALGLDPDATGYENIYLRGVLDGRSKDTIEHQIAEIAEFSELGEFLNLPVRTYSSGMSLRLAFAISTSIEADILLMDEWLSVGDANFTEKAEQRIEALIGSTSILIIATHNEDLLKRICNRKIHMEHGKILSDERL